MADILSLAAIKELAKVAANVKGTRGAEERDLANRFGDVVDLASLYVPPRVQLTQPQGEQDPNTKSASSFFQAFLGEATTRDDGSRCLLVLGDAGMGKTSLLKMMQLHHIHKFWPTQFTCSIAKSSDVDKRFVDELENKGNTILLIDAVDEDAQGIGRVAERIEELLDSTQQLRRVVITCRTQYMPLSTADPFHREGHVKMGSYSCRLVYLSYFNTLEVRRYLRKRFSKKPDQERAEEIVLQLGELQFRPMLLTYIDALMSGDPPAGKWTNLLVYKAVVSGWLNREEHKFRTQLNRKEVTAAQLHDCCRRLALRLSDKRARELSHAEFSKIIDRDPEMARIGEFEVGGRSLINRMSNGSWRFSHSTVQEFLIADAILVNKHLKSRLPVRVTDVTLSFLAEAEQMKISAPRNVAFDFRKPLPIKLSNRTVRDCVFDGCNLDRVDCRGTTFIKCSFKNTNLRGAIVAKTTAFESCNMSGAAIAQPQLDLASFDRKCEGIGPVVVSQPEKSEEQVNDTPETDYPDESWIIRGGIG